MRWLISSFAFVMSLAVVSQVTLPAQAASAQFPPGSYVGLAPPAGMTPSQTFPGFEDRDNQVSILISQLPAQAYDQLLKSMTSEAINIPGVSNAKREIVLTEGGAAHMLVGDQEAEGIKFRKWMMITRQTISGGGQPQPFAFIVTVQVPEKASASYSNDAVRQSLASLRIRNEVPSSEILDLLPFKIEDQANFNAVRSILPGRAVLLAEDAIGSEIVPGKPFMMVSLGGGAPAQPSDRGRFAEQLLRGIQGYKDLRPTFSEAVRIGNQPGHEIRLEGKSMIDDSDVMVVQWVRFGGQGFLRMVGITPKQQWPESFPRFRAVRDGIETR